jgi:hypothetical protein
MRISFLLWLVGVYYAYNYFGLLGTIGALLFFHVGVMRWLPYYLLDLEALNYYDIFTHMMYNDLMMAGNDYCYVRMDFSKGFDEACYE